MLYQIDVDYGLENEKICQSKIEHFLNEKLQKLDYYNDFDFTNNNNNLLIELKSRRCTISEYSDTMISISKINKAKKLIKNKNKNMQIYFFFYFHQNQLFYWKFDEKLVLRIDDNCTYRGVRNHTLTFQQFY